MPNTRFKNKKIATFIGDWFWSSIPYDGLDLYNELKNRFDTDLIMFSADIRLNKNLRIIKNWGELNEVFKNEKYIRLDKVFKNEKYYFDRNHFKNTKNLRIIKNWGELNEISKEYDLIICGSHIAPKSRYPPLSSKGAIAKCPVAVWDIGGTDMLTNGILFANYFFTKGPIWKEWLTKLGVREHNIFVTGSPHYDNFFESKYNIYGKPLSKTEFYKKYKLEEDKQKILVMPSNPKGHSNEFKEGLEHLKELAKISSKNNIDLILKTYPNDYIFNEKEREYSGVYKRKYTVLAEDSDTVYQELRDLTGQQRMYESLTPQYEFINSQFPQIKVIESQDHFSAVKYTDKIFNMAGSCVAWETFFTSSTSYTIKYKQQKLFRSQSNLPSHFMLPDAAINVDINNVEQLITDKTRIRKSGLSDYFLKEISIPNICSSIEKILNKDNRRRLRWLRK